MAQLPSGRHVAIQATPLFALIDAACAPEAISTRLLQIESPADLAPYIEVIYFRESANPALLPVAPGGHPVPSGLQPFASGYTLATIHEAAARWSLADQRAFAGYLDSERVQSHLSALLDRVGEVKRRLDREGDFVQRMQALMWEARCHPVQNDDRGDPMYPLLRIDHDEIPPEGA